LTETTKKVFYDSLQLVSKQGPDVQTVIAERDKVKAKADLLTDKCRKLLAKCKQLETKSKENESELSKAATTIDDLTSQLTTLKEEMSTQTDLINALEVDIMKIREREFSLEERVAEIDASNRSLAELKDQLQLVQRQLEESRCHRHNFSVFPSLTKSPNELNFSWQNSSACDLYYKSITIVSYIVASHLRS
jgi:chromosome segregation ATPase